jgi:hypothetical protein
MKTWSVVDDVKLNSAQLFVFNLCDPLLRYSKFLSHLFSGQTENPAQGKDLSPSGTGEHFKQFVQRGWRGFDFFNQLFLRLQHTEESIKWR